MPDFKKKRFTIVGMHCASCALNNEKALKALPGVVDVSVNFATHEANVTYDPAKVQEKDMYAAVVDTGYKVLDDETKEGHDHAAMAKHELAEAKQRMTLALALAIPTLVLAMFDISLPGAPGGIPSAKWAQLLLSGATVLWVGRAFHLGMLRQLKRFSANMDTLVSIGTAAALYVSIEAMFTGGTSLYFEVAAVITALILVGEYFEAKSRGRASAAVAKLLELGAKKARRMLPSGGEEEVDAALLRVGDIILVKPGEKMPADGKIKTGDSSADESMLTGESMAAGKHPGDAVYAATVNQYGALTVEVTRTSKDSVLAHIVRMVKDAQGKKAPIEHLVDKVSGIFVPIVILISLATFAAWIASGAGAGVAALHAVAVLVVACPCALGLATPTAIMVGTGAGALRGIVIKNGEALERARRIDTVIFDKTGTLTEGRPSVTELVAGGNGRQTELLRFAASVEALSEHPLARAIVAAAAAKGVSSLPAHEFLAVPGKGATAKVGSNSVAIGNASLIPTLPVAYAGAADRLESSGNTLMRVAVDGTTIGVIALSDPIKTGAKPAFTALREQGMEVIMITGDNRRSARAVADAIGIPTVISEVLPDQKRDAVKSLQEKGKSVAFVGDGINDAPALAAADLGIAIGTGSDIAIETGSVVIVKGSPARVADAILLSRRTFDIIKQNLFWAFFYNIIAIPLAAFGLLTPMIAAAAMSFSSVSVVSNSLRLRRVRFKDAGGR